MRGGWTPIAATCSWYAARTSRRSRGRAEQFVRRIVEVEVLVASRPPVLGLVAHLHLEKGEGGEEDAHVALIVPDAPPGKRNMRGGISKD